MSVTIKKSEESAGLNVPENNSSHWSSASAGNNFITRYFLSKEAAYILVVSVIILSFIFGLFVPLMDHDSAHHANIGLRMFLTGDYINLIDKGNPYLDKPHLLFWTSALSYHLFGVNAFAYKFPSFLFTLLGLWSTYKLASLLYNKQVGIYAILILSTAFAYSLGNSDVRMDAILSATMVFAAWQLIEYYFSRSWWYLLGASLGLALAFSTKGMIGPAVPAIALVWYLIYKKDFKFLLHPKVYLIIPVFFLLISPVLYAYYIQFDLHPELVIRGVDGRSGVKFILWDQSFERYNGVSFGGAGKKDYFFFLHSALWAFLPWALLFYIAYFSAVYHKIKGNDRSEYMTIGVVGFLLIVYSFAGFKLPHYLNTLFSFMAITTAVFFTNRSGYKVIRNIQIPVNILLLVVVGVINAYLFPMNPWVLGLIFLIYLFGVYLINLKFASFKKILILTALTGGITNLVIQSNFYPQLLKYQGGTGMLNTLNERKLDIPDDQIYYYNYQSFSFDFGKAYLHGHFYNEEDLVERAAQGPVFIYTHEEGKAGLENREDLKVETVVVQPGFHITRLKYNFINPATRKDAMNIHYLLKVEKNIL